MRRRWWPESSGQSKHWNWVVSHTHTVSESIVHIRCIHFHSVECWIAFGNRQKRHDLNGTYVQPHNVHWTDNRFEQENDFQTTEQLVLNSKSQTPNRPRWAPDVHSFGFVSGNKNLFRIPEKFTFVLMEKLLSCLDVPVWGCLSISD